MKPPLESLVKTPARRKLPALTTLAALILSVSVPHGASAQNAAAPGAAPHRLSARTLSQIAALEAEADARTPVQNKVDSKLLFSLKMMRGQPIALGVPRQRTGVELDGAGMTLVDIDGAITPALIAAIQHAGGQVVGSSIQFGQMRALVPLASVETLAAQPDVRVIKPAEKSQLQNPAAMSTGMRQMLRKADVNSYLPSLLTPASTTLVGSSLLGINFSAASSQSGVGSYQDEGDPTHQADHARSAFGINGSGIKVGVMSDSIDNGNGIYNDALNSGDVSTVTVISGQDGGAGSGEGLAMLEVVHHLAPGAQLYFATGASGPAQFASNIEALQQAGCKIIVDDESYSGESPFQDATIALAVDEVTAKGAMYFSSAANNGNLTDGTSSVWENDFNDSGDTSSGDGDAHQFDDSGDELDQITAASGQTGVSLFWTDPLGKSSNDYDLFIVDPNGNIVSSSTNRQTGSQDPYESAMAASGDYVAIVLHSGATRYLHVDLNAQRSTFATATTDRTRGHNAADNAFCIAATPAAAAQGDGSPSGPYPNPFDSSDVVEDFSNDGPREIYYNPDGSQITSSLTSSGGKSLNKPDFTAADGTTTTLTQAEVGSGKEVLSPFFGTSCAAPHAAAIAALVLSYNPTLTRSQLSTILKESSTDIMGSGYDVDSGSGILNAYKALQDTPAPTVSTSVHVANVSGTAGQSVTLSATLTTTSGGDLSGGTLTFKVDGASGNATTNSSGVASLSYTIPTGDSAGSHTVTVSFAGSGAYTASSGTGTLTVSASSSTYQVRYFPRVGEESRMVGGQFQGSANNSTWTTLYTVSQAPGDAYTTASLSTDPASFRYLRYLAPNGSYGDVAEIEFDSHGTKLTGTGFGTAGSYNNSGNTFSKALDGSTSTYFDAPAPGNGDYVGIDRGASGPNQVRYYPRVGHESRMVGGLFQGSSDNSHWTTLATVTATPTDAYTTAALSVDPATFRYLRYLAPNGSYGDVAEIEFDSHGTKLTGTGFGTAGSYNNSGNTFSKALDGSTSTYFDAPAPGNGDYVGIDRGASGPNQVRYYPRVGHESRMVGGLFQGSSDNSHWTTLATVTATPTDAYTTAALSVDPATFRYLRYLAPNGSYGDVAEIEFDSHGTKLTGTGFGTAGSYNNSGNTFSKALDGSTSTYFDAPAPGNGDYVGIDRGSSALTYTKLSGTGFGTAGSYNNSGTTFSKALDGSLSTYFDGPAPGNGDYVGLDLGSGHASVVTRIGYCPRSGYTSRMVGGVFQGSNDNSSWTALYTVSSAPSAGVLTQTTSISSGTAYRYLRYLAANGTYGDVAEIEFDTTP